MCRFPNSAGIFLEEGSAGPLSLRLCFGPVRARKEYPKQFRHFIGIISLWPGQFFFLSLSFIILICQMYCVKEQLKQAVKQIIDVIRRPFVAIGEAIRAVVKVLKQIVQKIKEVFLVIKRIVMCIGAGPVGVTFFDTLLISLI